MAGSLTITYDYVELWRDLSGTCLQDIFG